MKKLVYRASAILLLLGVILAGYFAPRLIWTRDDAVIALLKGTDLSGINTGNSRMPCRGPDKALYVFGYTLAISVKDAGSGSGSICWDIVNRKWDWRIDPPHEHLSSDRPPESRGAGSAINMRRSREEIERITGRPAPAGVEGMR